MFSDSNNMFQKIKYHSAKFTCSPTTFRTGTRLTCTKQKFPGPDTQISQDQSVGD